MSKDLLVLKMKTFWLEIRDDYFEVECISYHRSTHDEPGEVELADNVCVTTDDGKTMTITFDELVKIYADLCDTDIREAEKMLHDQAFEQISDSYAADREDAWDSARRARYDDA